MQLKNRSKMELKNFIISLFTDDEFIEDDKSFYFKEYVQKLKNSKKVIIVIFITLNF